MDVRVTTSVRLRTDLREALQELRQISKSGWDGEEYYRLDRRDAYDYFDIVPNAWRKKVMEYLRGLRNEGEYVTYVDICGRAQARSLGATENYSFSLQPVSRFDLIVNPVESNEEDRRFRGDLFSIRDFNRFIDQIRRNESRPALITFEPVAGLQSYIPFKGSSRRPRLHEEVTYQILERHLSRMVRIVRPGGYILLGPAFAFTNIGDFFQRKPQDQYESTLRLKAICKKLKCSIETHPTIHNGPRWLIRKWRERKKN